MSSLPIDNNHDERQIPWLFDGTLAAGHLKNVLARLPTQRASAVDELLPHLWRPAA